VRSLNLRLAERLYRARPSLKTTDLASLAAKRIGVQRSPVKPAAERSGDTWTLTTEGDSRIAMEVLRPSQGGSHAAVLYLDPSRSDVTALLKAGVIVAVPRLRGWEQPGDRRGSYSPNWQNAMRALLVGKTMVGLQTTDILKCFDLLSGLPEVDASRISIIAKGAAGVAALHAAVLEPRFRRVAVEESVTSYMAIARATIHRGLEDVIIPGVLKDYDLPDLARQIGPGRLWIVEPRMPSGARMRPEAAKTEYPGFEIRYRAEGQSAGQFYAEWLN
jgi:hypothetical protein